jgi:hypothetical protein
MSGIPALKTQESLTNHIICGIISNNAAKSTAQFAAIEQALAHLGTARRDATSENAGPLP